MQPDRFYRQRRGNLLRECMCIMQEVQDYLKTISPNLTIVRGDFDEGNHPDEEVMTFVDIYAWRTFVHNASCAKRQLVEL